MILPGKHLREDRALLGVGAEVLSHLGEETTVSELWEKVRTARNSDTQSAPLSFDWFVLGLSFLFAISAIELHRGIVTATNAP
ncbi:hypothetical protein QO010_004127 [Caulobacter ginsengisoli]|uniref:Uncharacterized protein n=1 Tax=Caulobacter ginsengisoli TaxID=400775 RepID=A0ABU0IZ57_9CAUL|nr:ABC-three component system middle component 6 [Caulobacter ginsengisoli]MDQ0466334.1 hypothetical protein [Caulobacter ginsengisoli]